VSRCSGGRGRGVYTWGLVSGLLHTGDTKLIKTNRKLVLLGDGVGHSRQREVFAFRQDRVPVIARIILDFYTHSA
jgi:hypothetical protein